MGSPMVEEDAELIDIDELNLISDDTPISDIQVDIMGNRQTMKIKGYLDRQGFIKQVHDIQNEGASRPAYYMTDKMVLQQQMIKPNSVIRYFDSEKSNLIYVIHSPSASLTLQKISDG